jgi:hypothetical protein
MDVWNIFSHFGMLYHETFGYPALNQGCQIVYFQTRNINLCKFWSALDWKILMFFMAICNILWTFGIFYDHLVTFYVFFGTFFPLLVCCA